MIIKGNTVGYNDGSGLYDTAGILRSAMQDINALMLQGVVNWNRAASALGKSKARSAQSKRGTKKTKKRRTRRRRNRQRTA